MPLNYGANTLKAAMEPGCRYQDLAACENLPECMNVDPYNRWVAGILENTGK